EPVNFKPFEHISEAAIQEATQKFTGDILQVPPAHSAIKVAGKRVYELARQGKEVILEPRKLTIKEFLITNIQLPHVHFKVVCSTGTYIRSLAYDFGEELGCGAYLSNLCRTKIGEYSNDDAMTIEAFAEKVKQGYKING
ncbi:MAG: tRNA pseudouridine(55) synthase, partial [Bacteroidota bacterium]